jgi:hypothetical protein
MDCIISETVREHIDDILYSDSASCDIEDACLEAAGIPHR